MGCSSSNETNKDNKQASAPARKPKQVTKGSAGTHRSKEYVHIHMGNCGINIGSEFWKMQSILNGVGFDRHFYGDSGATHNGETVESFYDEMQNGQYIPRSVFIDTDRSAIDSIKSFELKGHFDNSQFVTPKFPQTCGIFPRGCYTIGNDAKDLAIEAIRKQKEKCNSSGGNVWYSSISGGIYGLQSKLMEEFKDGMGFHVGPAKDFSEPIEYYNTILGLKT